MRCKMKGIEEERATWLWDGARNLAAPPGKLRLSLASGEQVAKIYEEIQGRAIQVCSDLMTIELSGDISLGRTAGAKHDPGRTERRAQASR